MVVLSVRLNVFIIVLADLWNHHGWNHHWLHFISMTQGYVAETCKWQIHGVTSINSVWDALKNNYFCGHPRNGDGGKSSKLNHCRLLQDGQWKQQDSETQETKMLSLESRGLYMLKTFLKRGTWFFLLVWTIFIILFYYYLLFIVFYCFCQHLLMFNGLQEAGSCCSLPWHTL